MSRPAEASIGVPAPAPRTTVSDPIRYCIYTTVALIAWVITPPAAVAWLAGLGMWGYVRAWRAGLRQSKCWLRDVRLVLVYLAAAFAAGAAFTARELVGLLR